MVDGEVVILPLTDGTVRALTVRDGQILWQAPLAAKPRVAADGGVAYIPTVEGLTLIRSRDGQLQGHITLDAPVTHIAVRSGWLVLVLETGSVIALDGKTGRRVWQRADLPGATAAPTLAADRLYLSLSDGRLASLGLLDGRTIWERRLAGRPGDVVALADRLYVGTSARLLYCLGGRDGATLWRWRMSADVLGPAAFSDGQLFVTGLDNMLRALDWRSGAQRWARPLAFRPSAGPRLVGDAILVPGLSAEIPLFLQRDGRSAGRLAFSAELSGPPVVATTTTGPAVVLVTGEESGPPRLRVFGPATDPPIVPLRFLPGAPPVEPALVPLPFLPGELLPTVGPPGAVPPAR